MWTSVAGELFLETNEPGLDSTHIVMKAILVSIALEQEGVSVKMYLRRVEIRRK
jgi:hypothetical protein